MGAKRERIVGLDFRGKRIERLEHYENRTFALYLQHSRHLETLQSFREFCIRNTLSESDVIAGFINEFYEKNRVRVQESQYPLYTEKQLIRKVDSLRGKDLWKSTLVSVRDERLEEGKDFFVIKKTPNTLEYLYNLERFLDVFDEWWNSKRQAWWQGKDIKIDV